MAERLVLNLVQGKTFEKVIRWESPVYVFKAIDSIAQAAPARVVTAAPHDLTDGWRCAVVSVRGMTQINAEDPQDLKERDFHRCTIVANDTVEFNDLNAAEFSPYVSGGYLQYRAPESLAGCVARWVFKDKVGGTELLRLTDVSGITLDDTAKTITAVIPAAVIAAFQWTRAVHELEIENGSGFVTGLYYGPVSVTKEVAT